VALEGVVGRIAVVIDASGEHTSPLPIVRLLAERRWRGRKRQVVVFGTGGCELEDEAGRDGFEGSLASRDAVV
jgi:hypothetical protein